MKWGAGTLRPTKILIEVQTAHAFVCLALSCKVKRAHPSSKEGNKISKISLIPKF
jgi:hypothetical protein